MRGVLLVAAALLVAAPATAAPLTMTKSSAVISDPTNQLLPKAIPGAIMEYTLKVTNPNGVAAIGLAVSDAIPANTSLYVSTVALGGSPIVFNDGSVAGLGGSGLTYTFTSLSSTSDSLDFSADNGATWTYVPTADANGCDARVTNIRVKPGSSQAAGSNFTIKFRVLIK